MNNEKDPQRYTAALGLLSQERQLFWQTFSAFFLPHTVLMAFLLQTISHPGTVLSWAPGAFSTSIIGFMLCVPWGVAQYRTGAYNDFRMAQAREAEPLSWKLLGAAGRSFAEGRPVTIDGEKYRLWCRLAWLRTMYAVATLILIFAVIYAAVALLTAPWWPQSASILL
jgi:hypothetical protein